MTVTLAAVGGGGAALAFHGSSTRPQKDCGLVPCAAALPASVRSGRTGPASAPATAAPTVARPSSAPSSPTPSRPAPVAIQPVSAQRVPAQPASAQPAPAAPASRPGPFSSPAPLSWATGRAVSADHAIGVGYAITEDSQQGIRGQIVIVNNGSAPVSGWRITLVLPGDRGYQVLDARNRSAGDALVMTSQADGRSLAAGGTELIAFTARGTTSSPVRSTFTASPRPRPAGRGGSGAAASLGSSAGGGRAGDHRHEGWPWLGGWPGGGQTRGHWPQGGWPQGGWPQGGWSGRGGPGSGRAGHHHGWPGGR